MNTFGSLFFQISCRSVLIWKKSGPKVFNWSEFIFSEVTSYKIHTLNAKFLVPFIMSTLRIWFEQVLFIAEFELIYNSVGGNSVIQLTLLCSGPALQSHGGKSHNDMHSRLHCNRESFFLWFYIDNKEYIFPNFTMPYQIVLLILSGLYWVLLEGKTKVQFRLSISHLFCTLISENQGLDKSRSVSKPCAGPEIFADH